MKKAKMTLNRLLYPPRVVLAAVPTVSFAALIFIFAANKTESMPAYFIYTMSAYSLIILIMAFPELIRKTKSAVQNSKAADIIRSTAIGRHYIDDIKFRGEVSIYQGMAVNFLYVIFKAASGIYYRSVWFLAMAVYYLVLGLLRTYLIYCYKHKGQRTEYRCYRNVAFMLFLLNIPMGVMILLMIETDSGFSYPGYVIYLSALYMLYSFIISIVNIVKFRKLGNPVLSASKALNFVAAMMSVLGLQTAMISRFSSDGDGYRRFMNTVTGGSVYGIVIIIAVYMLIHSRKFRKEDGSDE